MPGTAPVGDLRYPPRLPGQFLERALQLLCEDSTSPGLRKEVWGNQVGWWKHPHRPQATFQGCSMKSGCAGSDKGNIFLTFSCNTFEANWELVSCPCRTHSCCQCKKGHCAVLRGQLASNTDRPPYHAGVIRLGWRTNLVCLYAEVELFPRNLAWGKKAVSPIWEVKSLDATVRVTTKHFGKTKYKGDKGPGSEHMPQHQLQVLRVWKVTKMASSLSLCVCAGVSHAPRDMPPLPLLWGPKWTQACTGSHQNSQPEHSNLSIP